MAKYDVYQMQPGGELVVDLQSDWLDYLDTKVVAPLLLEANVRQTRLNPEILINGATYLFAPAYLATVPVGELTNPIANVDSYHDQITAALDFVFQGF